MAYPLCANESQKGYLKQGQSLGKSATPSFKLSPQEVQAITPEALRGQKFDEKKAHTDVLTNAYQSFDDLAPNVDPEITALVSHSDKILETDKKPPTNNLEEHSTTEKCLFKNALSSVTLHNVLSVEVKYTPENKKKVKICRGHHKEEKSEHPKDDKGTRERAFAADPTIKSFKVSIKEKGMWHRDFVISDWTHVEDAEPCNVFVEQERVISPEKWEELDVWRMDNKELLDNIDCTLVSIENGKKETRLIEGRKVKRPFWIKSYNLKCRYQHQIACDFLKEKHCILTHEICIQEHKKQCVAWEKIFQCITRNPQSAGELKDAYGADPKLWETTPYQPNKQLPDVTTKLAGFDEMKKELHGSQAPDVRHVQLFKGNTQKCGKSIVSDVMYDCCFEMDGLMTKLKFSKCTADEIALMESQKKGLCHYLGVKKEKFLDMWTSRSDHVFCVFPTKLARIFQEEARKQLGIDWGSAETPDCRGLTQKEIKKLDFSTLNLTEAFDLPPHVNNSEKIKKIEERLKMRLEENS
jgi:conjugal transfer mating pair stabilization protein TraN